MKIISIPHLHCRVLFTENKEEFCNLVDVDISKYSDSNGLSHYTGNIHLGSRDCIVGVFDGKLRTLVHELYHTIRNINERIAEYNFECIFSEHNAYLMEHLFDQFSGGLK